MNAAPPFTGTTESAASPQPDNATATIRPRFGAHMSIAGGLHNAFEHASRAGCDCVQIFVKNQRQWAARPLTEEEFTAWRDTPLRTNINPVVAHATYLLNMAAPDEDLRRKSTDAFIDELQRCHALGVVGLVVHPGAHLDDGVGVGCRRIADCLSRAVAETTDVSTEIWLEITAGQGSSVGHRFEHIRDIIAGMNDAARVGVCFDTCHALAAGYRFNDDESYAQTFAAFESCLGLDRLRCFHLNDSKRECGSRVDRHEAIGRGFVGLDGFRRIVNDPRFANVPMVMETPKGEDDDGNDLDRINLAALRGLLGVTTPVPNTTPSYATGAKPGPARVAKAIASPAAGTTARAADKPAAPQKTRAVAKKTSASAAGTRRGAKRVVKNTTRPAKKASAKSAATSKRAKTKSQTKSKTKSATAPRTKRDGAGSKSKSTAGAPKTAKRSTRAVARPAVKKARKK